jgi:dTDP-4-dehydrorhamnose reductase
LATVTAAVLRQIDLAGNEVLAGLYHLAASGETTWHAYATHVISQAKALRPDLPWAVQEIAPVPSSAFVTAARRPHNSRLDTRKLQAAFGINLPDWRQGVGEMLAHVLA